MFGNSGISIEEIVLESKGKGSDPISDLFQIKRSLKKTLLAVNSVVEIMFSVMCICPNCST